MVKSETKNIKFALNRLYVYETPVIKAKFENTGAS